MKMYRIATLVLGISLGLSIVIAGANQVAIAT